MRMLRAVDGNSPANASSSAAGCTNSPRLHGHRRALKICSSIVPVELWPARTPCLKRLRTGSPQNPPSLHRPFWFPCGSRGKNASPSPLTCPFSNSPELHSEDLENRYPSQTRSSRGDGQPFHFSCLNYGYYCLFLLLLIPFPTSPSRIFDGKECRAAEVLPPNPRADERDQEFRDAHRFSTHTEMSR